MTQADLEDLGFEVVAATTCEEAWSIVHSGAEIACLLTDIRTPGQMDGWRLAQQVREVRPDMPVVYVSGFSGGEARPVPGAIFLTKPYMCSDLEKALATLGVSAARPA